MQKAIWDLIRLIPVILIAWAGISALVYFTQRHAPSPLAALPFMSIFAVTVWAELEYILRVLKL